MIRSFGLRLLPLVVTLSLCAPPARAGDLADEADLHFELGTDRFRARDYKAALEQFLASNRLVPNRNVVANIGATYAALKQYPEAYRYYRQALDGETDPEAKADLEKALAKVAPQVSVLHVTSTPPGATVYIDRKELGPRGQTPTVLGFGKGHVKVMVEAEGFESPAPAELNLDLGKESSVELKLARVVGVVSVTGSPYGATVTVENLPDVGCALPCELQLPPGRRTLQIRKEGYLPGYRRVEVAARGTVVADFALAPVTGGLVVSSDEKGANVEVDGRLVGFTPAVLEVPVGERHVKVSLPGFAPQEAQVKVAAGEQARVELTMKVVEEVSAASRTAEKLEDAPASVSLISGNELRAMGYPTLWEALRSQRGVFLSDDHTYQSVGVRGFGPAGSYGNRILVLLDGHSMNDNWLGSSYVGYDGRSDLGDIERIEIVRGPGSVLYGTGAFSGVINLVTRPIDSVREVSATVATDETGLLRARASLRTPFGTSGGLALSASGLSGTGTSWYFADYAAAGLPATSHGSDDVLGGNVSLQLRWSDLTLAAQYNVRKKAVPTGELAATTGDDLSRYVDTRSYAELRYTPRLGEAAQIFARAYIDTYENDSQLAYPADQGGLYRENYWGTWVGAEARLTLTPHPSLRLMLGGEGQAHLRVEQHGVAQADTATPVVFLNQKNPFQVGAGYVNADWKAASWLHLSAGARFDTYSTFGSALSPRVAVIVKPYESGTTKLMAGKAFRAPSIYELYYNDNGASQLPNCNPTCSLVPETMLSLELEHTHRISDEWSAIASLYVSRMTDLVVLRDIPDNPGVGQFVNSTAPIRSLGGELELRREWRGGFVLSANYALQKTSYEQDDSTPADQKLREVPNSPIHSGGLRVTLPLAGRALRLSGRLSAESGRYTRFDQPSDPAQTRTDASALLDLVLSGEAPDIFLRWSAGLYNASDTSWSVPLSSEFGTLVTSPMKGRSFLAQLTFTR